MLNAIKTKHIIMYSQLSNDISNSLIIRNCTTCGIVIRGLWKLVLWSKNMDFTRPKGVEREKKQSLKWLM